MVSNKKHKWSSEEDRWLCVHARESRTYDELLSVMLNMGVNITRHALKARCKTLKCGIGRAVGKRYSKEEELFLRENCNKLTLQEMVTGIQSISGRAVTRTAISHYLTSIGMSCCGRHSTFCEGDTPWNMRRIGEEYTMKSGYVLVKVGENKWITKQRWAWQQYYGKPPEGIVIFLNGKKNDFAKENLYCIDRRINAVMNQNKWFKNDSEFTLTAIKWCEMYFVLKEILRRKCSQ